MVGSGLWRLCQWVLALLIAATALTPTVDAAEPTSATAQTIVLVYDPALIAKPPYDLTPWVDGGVDSSGGVSPYVVVVANEIARSVKGLPYAKKDLVEVGVIAVYNAYLNVHGGATILSPAAQLDVPEPDASELQAAESQILVANLPIDNTDWRK